VGEPRLADAVEFPLVPGAAEPTPCPRYPQPHWFSALENEPYAPVVVVPLIPENRLYVLPGDVPPPDTANNRGLGRQINAISADPQRSPTIRQSRAGRSSRCAAGGS
jgi:hypothetical protein